MMVSRRQPFGSPWQQMQQLQNELNRLFDRWTDDRGTAGAVGNYPALNVWEDGNSVNVEAELPGLDIKDLEIYVTGGNQLTIKGERKQNVPERSVWHRQERGYGTFIRVLALPFEVDANKVEARLENGVLLIKLAKHERAKPRKVTVKVG